MQLIYNAIALNLPRKTECSHWYVVIVGQTGCRAGGSADRPSH